MYIQLAQAPGPKVECSLSFEMPSLNINDIELPFPAIHWTPSLHQNCDHRSMNIKKSLRLFILFSGTCFAILLYIFIFFINHRETFIGSDLINRFWYEHFGVKQPIVCACSPAKGLIVSIINFIQCPFWRSQSIWLLLLPTRFSMRKVR